MEKTLSDLDTVYALINLEWERYKQAIKNNQKFDDVKVIYLNIKALEQRADELMKKANAKLQ